MSKRKIDEDCEPTIEESITKRLRLEPTAETQVSPIVWNHSLSPNSICHTTILMKSSQSPHSKPADLQDCLTPAAFVETVYRLWNLNGNVRDIKELTCEMQTGKAKVLLSKDIEAGHRIMISMTGEWWAERIHRFAYHCFAILLSLSSGEDNNCVLLKREIGKRSYVRKAL